jgi:hypothetical protein
MTGDDLVTMVTEAPCEQGARDIVFAAPAGVVRDAADLLYIDPDFPLPAMRRHIVREARS